MPNGFKEKSGPYTLQLLASAAEDAADTADHALCEAAQEVEQPASVLQCSLAISVGRIRMCEQVVRHVHLGRQVAVFARLREQFARGHMELGRRVRDDGALLRISPLSDQAQPMHVCACDALAILIGKDYGRSRMACDALCVSRRLRGFDVFPTDRRERFLGRLLHGCLKLSEARVYSRLRKRQKRCGGADDVAEARAEDRGTEQTADRAADQPAAGLLTKLRNHDRSAGLAAHGSVRCVEVCLRVALERVEARAEQVACVDGFRVRVEHGRRREKLSARASVNGTLREARDHAVEAADCRVRGHGNGEPAQYILGRTRATMPLVHLSKKNPGYRIVPPNGREMRKDPRIMASEEGMHYADAAAAARLLQAEQRLGHRQRDPANETEPGETYASAHQPVQHGSGVLRRALRHAARLVVDEGIKRTPGAHHLRQVRNLFTSFRKRSKGVATEDGHHLVAAADAYKKPDERRAAGYEPEHSTPEIAVYHRPTEDAPHHRLIASRGSVNRDDARTDAHLALGRLRKTNRFKREHHHLLKLREKIPEASFTFTGHSLGGTLAQHHARDFNGTRTVTFNPGATVFGESKDRNGRVYSTHGDAVSALAHLTHGDVRVVRPQAEGDDSLLRELDNHFLTKFQAPDPADVPPLHQTPQDQTPAESIADPKAEQDEHDPEP